MSIPLIQKPDKDDINTSIIAIKRNIERINMLLGLSNSEEIDTSKFATKEELQQAVTDLQPVNEVAVDNMQSVTSNAVAGAIEDISSSISSKADFLSYGSSDLMTAFAGVGIPDEYISRTAKYLCDNIGNYGGGIHSISIGGPAYGFVCWMLNTDYYAFDILSYSDHQGDLIRVVKSGGNYLVYRYKGN